MSISVAGRRLYSNWTRVFGDPFGKLCNCANGFLLFKLNKYFRKKKRPIFGNEWNGDFPDSFVYEARQLFRNLSISRLWFKYLATGSFESEYAKIIIGQLKSYCTIGLRLLNFYLAHYFFFKKLCDTLCLNIYFKYFTPLLKFNDFYKISVNDK